MRRPRRAGASCTIEQLLARQPKSLARSPLYGAMMRCYRASERLRNLRIGGRCRSLLHRARIRPENLRDFYRTYRLPADPFFPLFLAVKRDYLAERERIAEERRRYILGALRALPAPALQQIKYLGFLECSWNAAGDAPLWQKHIFPGSKRRADACARYGPGQWLALFRTHLDLLARRYRALTPAASQRILACFALGLVPQDVPPPPPDPDAVHRAYRRMSMLHHPDRGGDPELFIEIKRARDTLLAERRPQNADRSARSPS